MAHVYADRVKEISFSGGTGALVLSGPPAGGFREFGATVGLGNTTDICIRDTASGAFEVTRATIGAGTITRGLPLFSSTTGARVNFDPGTQKEIFCVVPADQWVGRDEYDVDLLAKADAAATTAALATKIGDAASDGTPYVRQSGAWVALPRAVPLVTVADAVHAPTLVQAGAYILCTNAAGCAIEIPAEASVAFPAGTQITYEQGAAGALVFSGAVGVTLRVAATHLAQTLDQHAVVQLVKVGADTWTLFGNLEPA